MLMGIRFMRAVRGRHIGIPEFVVFGIVEVDAGAFAF